MIIKIVEDNLEGMETAEFYLDTDEGEKATNAIVDLGVAIKDRDQILRDSRFGDFLKDVIVKEKAALEIFQEEQYWFKQKRLISDRIDAILKDRQLLPDDIEKLQDYSESEKELTFDDFIASKIYEEGLNNKKALVSEIDKKFDALMGEIIVEPDLNELRPSRKGCLLKIALS